MIIVFVFSIIFSYFNQKLNSKAIDFNKNPIVFPKPDEL